MNRRTLLTAAAGGTTAAMLAGTPAAAEHGARESKRRFHGKVVVITGATSGIGRATALAFAAQGAKVGFCGRRTQLGHEVVAQIRRAGGEAHYVQADVRHEDQVKSFVDQIVARYGRLDIAVNNAGIRGPGLPHEVKLAEWDDVLNTNTRGTFLAIKHEVPHMLRNKGGVIVCTSSLSAERARPDGAAYSASKAGINGLVKAVALAYATQGIRINAIMPGTTDTPFSRPPGIPDPDWERFKALWGPLNVGGMERMATADEIAAAVLGLASGDFPFMTGACVHVDGGDSAGRKMVMPPIPAAVTPSG
ncbi:SDR family NAD(P)-dependent oxidoreductase [Kibdelosporangium persicum]|uniref:Short chain dehydrogenase reductase n=1 Tax=Kibdelosporangium persicum TaxID=2698649 RepID=A0ABX2F7W1_9PSEU|nr:SDR family oxidoreductase [Kibdelosporangium persicum]NRN67407.1 Short chain dehydrogenase reductase [Kibdelosporangium persicum]